jgi:hypothetical protein
MRTFIFVTDRRVNTYKQTFIYTDVHKVSPLSSDLGSRVRCYPCQAKWKYNTVSSNYTNTLSRNLKTQLCISMGNKARVIHTHRHFSLQINYTMTNFNLFAPWKTPYKNPKYESTLCFAGWFCINKIFKLICFINHICYTCWKT